MRRDRRGPLNLIPGSNGTTAIGSNGAGSGGNNGNANGAGGMGNNANGTSANQQQNAASTAARELDKLRRELMVSDFCILIFRIF